MENQSGSRSRSGPYSPSFRVNPIRATDVVAACIGSAFSAPGNFLRVVKKNCKVILRRRRGKWIYLGKIRIKPRVR